jgi:hypothetical protein
MAKAWVLSSLALTPLLAAADFARDVAPIFESRCQMCHGAQQQMGGLRLDQPLDAVRAGKLIERITSDKSGFRMPPIGSALAGPQIDAIKSWIDAGARWPDGYRPQGKTSGHWAFQKIQAAVLPQTVNRSWARNPIDRFVLARLEKESIPPSPEADRNTLLRRLSMDLTGLPPTPAQIREFAADTQPDAYERVADRLLASPRYGEKWARPWLDLARYADSDGYEKDLVRPYAWRYRDWVIEALNRDLPFDQFTIEQIAGDLLPGSTVEQRVATGFHRNTLTNREAGVDRAEARFEQLVNRVNTVSTTWLGLTAGCAQCHDHKYDPITAREFYQLFAFFDSAAEEDIEAPLIGEREPYDAALPAFLARRGHVIETYGIAALQQVWEKRVLFAIENPGVNLEWDFSVTSMRAMLDGAEKMLKTHPSRRSFRQNLRLTDYFLSSPGPDNNRDRELRERIREAREKLQELAASMPKLSMAQTLVSDPDAPPTHMRVRGDYRSLGQPVAPGGLAVLPPMPAGERTRLELARWLVSRENPLTARVTVNRIWQELFGAGLVRTSEDFGTQGERPSHPELLDWLAARFVEDGWSLKKIKRLIVTSATYRQASTARPELAAKDPDNRLLARQSRLRLSAESIRDSALSAAGLLDARIGGPSIRPPQPPGVAELGYANSVKWKESEGADRYRRGLYIHFQRTTPYPQLMNFDAPDSNVACSRRRSSNTPLQSLNLLNDPVFFESAQALAARILDASGASFAERLEQAFLLTLGRRPAAAERERMARYYDQQLGILHNEPDAAARMSPAETPPAAKQEAAAWVALTRVLLNLDEFITRE